MNERIRQLAEQAGIEFTYDPTETPMRAFVECWEDEMAKFAELIVRECIAQCEKNKDHEWLGSGSKLSAFNIKEHFGASND